MGSVTEPFPISRIAGRYLLFDIDVISYARRTHNTCGVLIGTLPNLSQQNVFLGIPLELMPEEARVLIERGHAYIVDDEETHRKGFLQMSREDRLAYLQYMDELGLEASMESKRKLEERAAKALKGKDLSSSLKQKHAGPAPSEATSNGDEESLFDSSEPGVQPKASQSNLIPHFITPATSYPPLSHPPVDRGLPLPEVPRSYPLFRYMHSKGYFSTPGLRFGCHYTIYPGDPLRFHSHFLATGLDWDEEFDLLDVIGGGRLGTGVKKSYLLGGEDPTADAVTEQSDNGASVEVRPVRTFSIEWAGM
ncbi:tRNA-splicing endonuclease subunit sen34 [Westerdykella ornata]|uniref:tRNA-splicing endonuclease subunit Sen34 n=1 Tax=Westerdykella ornata TaxID=318751 RepID=A0A6A6J9S3_WESOR|nr:tRNA-splicing endonuclease subunit sen34 [Westerdykella ornata]KAF2272974.1 tRNA-splicing endonuclease subunit sen34 [Westerdykella ornata]